MTAAQKKKDINTDRNRAIVYSLTETGVRRGTITKLDSLNYSSSLAKQVCPLRAVRMDVERFKQEHRA